MLLTQRLTNLVRASLLIAASAVDAESESAATQSVTAIMICRMVKTPF